MGDQVLLVGGGGREHAIACKLSESPKVGKVFVFPGNPGMEDSSEKIEVILTLDFSNHSSISDWCKSKKIDLVVIGPEIYLNKGIVDSLTAAGIKCFGSTKKAADIECSKEFAKKIMDEYGIPTAKWKSFKSSDDAVKFIRSKPFKHYVIKASGLCAGKGVFVTNTDEEAIEAVKTLQVEKKFGSSGNTIVIEELLSGPEVSMMAFTDGKKSLMMLPAQDYKRVHENNLGPNTGGMGAYCPYPLSDKDSKFIEKEIIQRTVDAMADKGLPIVGVLFAGLMLTESGVKVLEFNSRFGDPETEVVLPLLKSDLYDIMMKCATGSLSDSDRLDWLEDKCSIGIIMASKGYPESSSRGDVIEGLSTLNLHEVQVFHCGTEKIKCAGNYCSSHNPKEKRHEDLKSDMFSTNGGRVLIIVAVSSSFVNASANVIKACQNIRFDGCHYRRDIGFTGIAAEILDSGCTTYKESGVDIVEADRLIDNIKKYAKATIQPGVEVGIGQFAAVVDVKKTKMVQSSMLKGDEDVPLIVSGTDGVGTKIKIAQETNKHDTIGIDLVAMCVNDVLAIGAQPVFFLDYFATSQLDVKLASEVIKGIAEGCKLAKCSLVGGETAEMPGIYKNKEYDLAGFSVGVVSRSQTLPKSGAIMNGDILVGIPSSGLHSNGFSLVRKIVQKLNLSYDDVAPFSVDKKTLGEEFLTPTRIYTDEIMNVLPLGLLAVAHITGGGIVGNLERVVPDNFTFVTDATRWKIPSVFSWLAVNGNVSEDEMLSTFNCGLGMILVFDKNTFDETKIKEQIPDCFILGKVEQKTQIGEKVKVLNFKNQLAYSMVPFVRDLITKLVTRKRIAVFISGYGSNLQSLIDATRNSHLAKIALVISDRDKIYGLERAKKANIDCRIFKKSDYKGGDYDEKIIEALHDFDVDIVCLAGFMKILKPPIVSGYRDRLLNIHPSLLPSFKGQHAVRQALDAGVKITGTTVHLVDEEVDHGQILAQESVPIEDDDTEETLMEKIKSVEHKLYPKVLFDFIQGKFKLKN